MKLVLAKLAATPASAAASSDAMLDLSAATKQLYELADQLASPKNFGERPGFKRNRKLKSLSSMGVVHPQNVEPPIYDVVRRLAAAKKAGQTLTADQDALLSRPINVQEHATALNNVP